MAPIKAAPAGP